MPGWLGKFHPQLMLDDAKDLVNQQLQEGETEASFAFVGVGKVFSVLCVEA